MRPIRLATASLCIVLHAWKAWLVMAAENRCGPEKKSEYGIAVLDSTFRAIPAADFMACLHQCNHDDKCYSANFRLLESACELNSRTRATRVGRVVHAPMSIYMPSTVRELALYRPVGCYRHNSHAHTKAVRALNQEWKNGEVWYRVGEWVEMCAQQTIERYPGWRVFGLQGYHECRGGPTPELTYKMMKAHSDCQDGYGIGMAMYVYEFN